MVNVFFYNTVNDFKADNPIRNQPISFTDKDFIRYLINLGSYSNKSLSFNGWKFYFSLVKMAIVEDNNILKISDDYYNAESSIKTAISYFIGSLSAYALAEKVHRVSHLYHLKDPIINNINRYNAYNKKTPDFFGLKNFNLGSPILIEAKGTSKSRLDPVTVTKAKDQVNAISSINFRGSSQPITHFERHVIGAYFKGRELNFCDIDPNETGSIIYEFDADSETLMYYRNIMFLLLFNSNSARTITLNDNNDYIVVEFEGYNIGLNTLIFNRLKNYYNIDQSGKNFINISELEKDNETSLFDNIFRLSTEINSPYDDQLQEDPSISLGRDGIIVF